ncbi:MAG: pyridoxamine 5-phosphate oxidase [Pseudonocardiales bacterium]|nr:pyridoxamine 5-phosphate oxidase [Pseudonocardiales bacterium]MDT7753187.1 pyridoxamine 5-phosphate oxidase [Pseudonocardiales bacterium]
MAIQLDAASLPAGPMPLLAGWFGEARGAGLAEPRAMVLSTADPGGAPSARTVLATVIDDSGVTFHSSHPTRKTRDLAENPRACAVFGWYDIGAQVVLTGTVERLPAAETDAAFAARPRYLQLLAWAYERDSDPDDLAGAAAVERDRWGERIPDRPPGWLGFRLRPEVVDFWRGPVGAGPAAAADTGAGTAHERVRYALGGGSWHLSRELP